MTLFSSDRTYYRIYVLYFSINFAILGIILVILAVQRKAEIEAFYAITGQCGRCYNVSQDHPSTLYEFGYCSKHGESFERRDNLLFEGSLYDINPTSDVSLYVVVTSVSLGLLVLFGAFMVIGVYLSDLNDVYATSSTSVVLSILRCQYFLIELLLTLLNSICGLYRDEECYVSTMGYKALNSYDFITTAYFVFLAIEFFFKRGTFKIILLVLEVVMLLGLLFFTFAESIVKYNRGGKDIWFIALATFLCSHLFVSYVALFGWGILERISVFFDNILHH